MSNILVSTGTWFWRYMPFKFVRQMAWNLFLWMVRDKKTIKEIDGVTFDLDLGEMIDACIYVNRFEKEVTCFIDIAAKPGMVVLDIGANIGAHCLRFARIVGEGGKVYAFEPTEYAYAKLQRNIALNKFSNIEPYRVALSNQNLLRQKIDYRSSWKTDGTQAQGVSVVDFIRLDDWAKGVPLVSVDIIKIDVDGNEFSVLYGGRELLSRFKPIVIAEVGAWHFADIETNPWAILYEMGYRFWDLQSMCEYLTLEQLKERLPQKDPNMGFSINVVAKLDDSPWGIV
jgi:FkbM family methyltransferase